jgi:hypothetical protein
VTTQTLLFEFEQQIQEEIENRLNDTLLGRYAEFMVCADLTKQGYEVVHVDAPGFDIILSVDGASWRVQVKSTRTIKDGSCIWQVSHHSTPSNGKKALTRINRAITRKEADLLALFHHQFDTTVYFAVGHYPRRGRYPRREDGCVARIELPVAQVRGHAGSASLEVALRYLAKGGRGVENP